MKKQEQYVDNWIRERTGLGSALTAENLRAWQQERVREAEIYAAEHAAFYRDRKEALLSPEPGHHFFITAEDIRRRPEDFLCVSPKEIARIITIPTSGSTGRPKRIFFTEEDLMATADFFTPGMAYMTEPGQMVTVFMEGEQVYSIGGLLRIALERREISTRVHGFVHDLKEAEQAAQGADCPGGSTWADGASGGSSAEAPSEDGSAERGLCAAKRGAPPGEYLGVRSLSALGHDRDRIRRRRRVRSSLRVSPAGCRSHDRDYPSGDRRKCAERHLGGSCILCVCPQGMPLLHYGPAILAVSVRMRVVAEVFCRAWIKLWGGSRIPFSFITETRFPFISWTKSCSRWMAFTIMPRS